jgi:diguanylate cyclase (GGDEF)-like protein
MIFSHLTLVHSSGPQESAELRTGNAAPSPAGGKDAGYAASRPVNILLVEDNPADRRLVAERLGNSQKDFQLVFADRISEALYQLAQHDISIILLDLQLPDCRDLESLTKIHAAASGIPIVVLSEVEDESLALKALQLGAQDFLVKWHTNEHLLIRAVQYALERKQVEEHLYHLAHHDTLTGLPNRKFFYDQFKKSIALARRNDSLLAVMFMDLGDFKQVNDTLGHHCGDMLLQMVAKRLSGCVRETDCLARMGGDEFIIAFTVNRPEDAKAAASKLLEIFAEPFVTDGHMLYAKASVGISIYPSDGEDMETLIRNADMAMYRAKTESGDSSRYWFYSPEFNARTAELMLVEERLQRAMAHNEFAVYYQPQVDIRDGTLIGMEALLRWEHPERGLLMPSQFMQEFEETGFMSTAGEWVLREACRQNKAWQDAGHPPLAVAVNISSQELRHKDFVQTVRDALEDSGLAPQWLELEIREQAIEEDESLALSRLTEINALGVRIALDNLGHSHIPLSFLTRFPIHSIKIDRSIVTDVATDANHAAVAKAVIAVARVLNIKGLAEGVETQEQLNFFRTEHCNDAQGYMFGKPLPPLACTELFGKLQGGSLTA